MNDQKFMKREKLTSKLKETHEEVSKGNMYAASAKSKMKINRCRPS